MAAHGAAIQQHKQGLSNGMLGFILFLSSEVMFFGGLFAAYFIARADVPPGPDGIASWPPDYLLSAEKIAAGVKFELNFPLTLIATIILILSSVTIQIGVFQIQKGRRSGMIWWFFVSIVLGLVFLSIQMYDYSQLPFRSGDTIFGTTFYTLTGFHGAHVAGGIIFMIVIMMRAMGGQFSADRHEAVEACSFYWHFVDIVWIALFTTLYIVG
ncbi:MAG: heme-copper oxidase subunit III [Chloroflexi bacterium]|nr:heme-copper oxidase subunit III [Chloroflexota bacterium]